MFAEKERLIHQAQSGDVYAFAQLFEDCVEYVYRYITFRVENDRVAEDITVWVYCKAWQQLGHYRESGVSINAWLYKIAQKEIISYYRTHTRNANPYNTVTMVIGNRYLSEDFQDMVELQTIREALQFLPGEEQQILILKFIAGLQNKHIARFMSMRENRVNALQFRALQSLTMHLQKKEVVLQRDLKPVLEDCLMKLSTGKATLDQCLIHYSNYAEILTPFLKTVSILNSKRNFMPSPTFIAFARFAIIRFAQSHPRRSLGLALSWRTSMAIAVLVFAVLVTGTAHAQSAMPGEMYYKWKRTSELAWSALAPNHVAVDIALSERRLTEWIAVANDPILSIIAEKNYEQALSTLDSRITDENLDLIVAELQSQQEILKITGLSYTFLDHYLAVVTGSFVIPVTGVEPAGENSPKIEVLSDNNAIECTPNCKNNQDFKAKGGVKNIGNGKGGVKSMGDEKGNKGGNSEENSSKDKDKEKDK